MRRRNIKAVIVNPQNIPQIIDAYTNAAAMALLQKLSCEDKQMLIKKLDSIIEEDGEK